MWSRGRAFIAAIAIMAVPVVADAAPRGKGKGTPTTPEPPTPAAPAPTLTPEQQRAQVLFNQGRDHLAAKEYEAACDAFTLSQKADPSVGTQLNLGLCFEQWGKTASAYHAYVEAERLALERADDRAAGARARLQQIGVRVPHLKVIVPAELGLDARFLLDGIETPRSALAGDLEVDPGTHVIEVRVRGREPQQTTVVLVDADHKQVSLEAPPELPPVITVTTRRRPAKLYGGLAAGVVGVGAIAAASIISLGARSDYRDAIGDCPGGVCAHQASSDRANDARASARNMTFVAAGGIVLVGVGAMLVLTSKVRIEERHPAVTFVPMLAPGQVGLAIGGSL